MPMNNAEVVAFSSKDLGCPQLLDEPLLTAPQSCFRSFDVDYTGEVLGDVRGQGRSGTDPVTKL